MVSFRSLALLGLTATLASAQQSGTLVPTTTGGVAVPTSGVSDLPGWHYIGCAAPPSVLSLTASEVFRGPENDAETCAALCGGSAFFFLVGPTCHCTNALSNGTTFVPQSECSTPCPGNAAEFCGRSPSTAPLSRRQAVLGGARISVYRQTIIPAGLVYVDVDVLVYVDINININVNITNNVNINNYFALPWVTNTWCVTTTRTGCGCDTTYTVPVRTETIICTQCGPSVTTITLTVPTALPTATRTVVPVAPVVPTIAVVPTGAVPAGTTTRSVSPIFTGGAVANGISGGLALAAGALALL